MCIRDRAKAKSKSKASAHVPAEADAEADQPVNETWTEPPSNDLFDWVEESTVAIDEVTTTDD
eukprot:10671548-Karenia_brevis.AAC.1